MAKEEYLGKIVTALSGVNQGKAPELSHIKRIANALEGATKASGKSVVDMLDSTSTTEVTHDELVALRDASKLIPGALYRITDYVATTTQDDTRSANHPFDIIVVADSKSSLNENALAAKHEGDEYFELAHFEGWNLKYCLDNDRTRFAWADRENGKGVIYWMQDEWANEAHYDLKGIQFLRSANWFSQHESWAEDIFDGEVPEEDKYFYFLSVLVDGEVKDASLVGNSLENDEEKITGVYGNKDSLVSEYDIYTEEKAIYALSKNCFVGIVDSGYYSGCHDNILGNSCINNTFGNACYSNRFGDSCISNTFGNGCYRNTFGNTCHNNTFGSDCHNNTFGVYSHSNTFGGDCSNNTSGPFFYNNTFGDSCYANTFGSECSHNIIGDFTRFVIVYPTVTGQLNVVANADYPQFVGRKSGGAVMVWTIDDIINA